MFIKSKTFTVLYAIVTGIISGFFSLYTMNFWEMHFHANSGFLYPPIISLFVFLILLLAFENELSKKEKAIRSIIFLICHSVVLYGILISIIGYMFSYAGRQGALL